MKKYLEARLCAERDMSWDKDLRGLIRTSEKDLQYYFRVVRVEEEDDYASL